jgi:hypothetical protein
MKQDETPKKASPERISLAPLDPVEALKGLLAVDPDSKPEPESKRPQKRPKKA